MIHVCTCLLLSVLPENAHELHFMFMCLHVAHFLHIRYAVIMGICFESYVTVTGANPSQKHLDVYTIASSLGRHSEASWRLRWMWYRGFCMKALVRLLYIERVSLESVLIPKFSCVRCSYAHVSSLLDTDSVQLTTSFLSPYSFSTCQCIRWLYSYSFHSGG